MSDIDEVKSRLNIVEVIGERLSLKKAGRNFKALCPFHSEKTPSFVISPDRQIFHCFGCGRGGSVIDFVMLYEHVDFGEALETLAERAGVKLERRAPDTPQAKLKQKLYEVNHLASEFYHFLLTKHRVGERARQYLKQRGITDKSLKTFSLGYSPNDWDGLLNFLRKKGYEEELLETGGLVIRGTKGFYDRFRGRVMFALKDHRGNTVGFAGRLLDPEAREAKYVNTSETPVYVKSRLLYGLDVTREAVQKADEAIVMEGEFDVISSFQAGIPNVVAIKGSALTEDHARLLRRFAERLIFALDVDPAGDAAARRGIEIAEKSGFDMRVVTLPLGKDPDEAARESPGLLKKAIKTALPIYDYFIESAKKRFDVASAFGKKKISEELLPVVAKIDNPVVTGHYVRKLADLLEVSEERVSEALAKTKVSPASPSTEAAELPGKPSLSRLEKLEIYLLALLLQGKTRDLMNEFTQKLALTTLVYPPVERILKLLVKFLEKQTTFSIKEFVPTLPSELIAVLDEAFLWDVSTLLADEVRFLREWHKSLKEHERLWLRHRIKSLSEALRQKDPEERQLQQELASYTAQLKTLEKDGQI